MEKYARILVDLICLNKYPLSQKWLALNQYDKKILICVILYFLNIASSMAKDCVILLHGLARTQHSMAKLAANLQKNHYIVINQNYPSTKKTIHELAEENLPALINQCLKYHPTHIDFVTHSLGGLILQDYLYHHDLPQLQNFVMLAPPNHGSPLADLLQDNWLIKTLLGPSLPELTIQRQKQFYKPKYCKIGIIAGNFSFNPLAKIVFQEPNDGTVAVASARMPIANDFLTLPVSHTFIMGNKQVIAEVIHFLTYGHFQATLS